MSNKDSIAFLIEEYKAARSEILDRSRLDQQLQRNGNLSIIAVLGFYYSGSFEMDNPLILLAGAAIAFYTLLTQARFKQYGTRLGQYIKVIEKRIHAGDENAALGWETQLESIRENEKAAPSGLFETLLKVVKGEGYALGSTQLDRAYWAVASIAIFVLFIVEAAA